MVRSLLSHHALSSRTSVDAHSYGGYGDTCSVMSSTRAGRPSLSYGTSQSSISQNSGHLGRAKRVIEPSETGKGQRPLIDSVKRVDGTHYQVIQDQRQVYAADAIPSTPTTFKRFFPTTDKLFIHHDDTTSDGNMNLRVDSEVVGAHGGDGKLTLFHLRMHDLTDRHFSLMKYHRESGCKVGSSVRRETPQRAYSGTASSTIGGPIQITLAGNRPMVLDPRGPSNSGRYYFELGGRKYEWKAQRRSYGQSEDISYCLIDRKTAESIAHITPSLLTATEAHHERALGSWVPPCTMRLTGRSLLNRNPDLAE